MSTQQQLDFEAEIRERIRKNLADLEVKIRPGSHAKVFCRDCTQLIPVTLTGEITKTTLLGDIIDWMRIQDTVYHACLGKDAATEKTVHKINMIYRLHAHATASEVDRRWKSISSLTIPQGTVMTTMSAIAPILEDDFRKGNIHAGG